MSDYCHRRSYPLRYTEFDFKDELKLSGLLGIVQEAACTSADELGFGYDALKPRGLGFIIVFTYGEIRRPVKLGDSLTVETWPLPPRHVIFERHYRVLNGAGELAAALASRWCLVDLNTFALLPPDALGQTHFSCPYRAEKTVEVPGWKIPKLGEDKRECYRMQVRNSDCDHYLHANNTRYADFFLDCFPMDGLKSVKSFSIAYGKQAKEGSELVFYRRDEGDTSVCEAHCGGELFSQFRVTFGGNE